MIFVGKHISLRRITHDDCTVGYVSWLQDPEVNKYLETRHQPQSLFSVVEFVTQQLGSKNSCLLAIIENFTSTHIGNIKLGNINTHHRSAELSYFIGNKGYWGRGFGSEAIRGAVLYGFSTYALRTIRAGTYGKNMASRKALAKNGFIQRGSFPDELLGADGERDSHEWFSIDPTQYVKSNL